MSITVHPPNLLNKGTGQSTGITEVQDTSTEIVPENLQRAFVTLLNRDNNDVFVACDVDAILGQGEILTKNGGSMLIDATSFTSGSISGICASGRTALVTFQEFNKS